MRLLHKEQSITYSRVTAVITPSNQLTCQYLNNTIKGVSEYFL